jgi:hypothetical protein
MKRIEVRLSVTVVAPLLDVIRELADGLKHELAAPQHLEQLDVDLRDAWQDDLLQSQNADIKTLLDLFNEEFFRDGAIVLDEDNADNVIRACAAVRLALRSNHLQDIEEESMESGNIDLEHLPEPTRKTFVSYLFLATMQELIIQHLEQSSPET